jgi:hypothetical protein
LVTGAGNGVSWFLPTIPHMLISLLIRSAMLQFEARTCVRPHVW